MANPESPLGKYTERITQHPFSKKVRENRQNVVNKIIPFSVIASIHLIDLGLASPDMKISTIEKLMVADAAVLIVDFIFREPPNKS